MRSNTSLLGRVLLWIASEMLEILTKIFRIIFNYNLFRVLRVFRGFFFLVAYGRSGSYETIGFFRKT